jgi:hypothetical protein
MSFLLKLSSALPARVPTPADSHETPAAPAAELLSKGGGRPRAVPAAGLGWAGVLAAVWAIVLVGLALAGGYSGFSATPIVDMWNGYLDFYVRVSDGDLGAWWDQHNEHRILLAKALFWVDLRLFNGTSPFLVIVNYLLLGACCVVMLRIWHERTGRPIGAAGFVMAAWLFMWAQHENLLSPFQSQFLLVQLLPLAGFWMLHRSLRPGREGDRAFTWAAVLGLLSIATMANGLLVLPLMVVLALVLRLDRQRVLTLAALSLLAALLYLPGLSRPERHASLTQTFLEHPLGVIEYGLLYLGGPFHHLIPAPQRFTHGMNAGIAAGAVMALASIGLAWQAMRAPRRCSLQLALLTFIAFVGATALVTGGGRLNFGLGQALSNRYVTPALIAWAALFVVVAPSVSRMARPVRLAGVLALLVAITPVQLGALKVDRAKGFEHEVAVLALALNIEDEPQLTTVFPVLDELMSYSREPARRGLSVFGDPPYRDAAARIGTPVSRVGVASETLCDLVVESARPVDAQPGWVAVRGWILGPGGTAVPGAIDLVDPDGKLAGIALVGEPRKDLPVAGPASVREAGFKGYVRAEAAAGLLTAIDHGGRCRAAMAIPAARADRTGTRPGASHA